MSGFRNRKDRNDVERRLRAERPTPRDSFVRMLTGRLSDRPRRARGLGPRLAVVGALTAVMIAALGAVGSIGNAENAMSSAASSVRDLTRVHATTASEQSSSPVQALSTQGSQSTGSLGQAPFQHQYGNKYPICHKGRTLYLPPAAYVAHLLHGDTPGRCGHTRNIKRKYPICHNGKTLRVPLPAYLVHLIRHGDKPGACASKAKHKAKKKAKKAKVKYALCHRAENGAQKTVRVRLKFYIAHLARHDRDLPGKCPKRVAAGR